MKSILIVLVSFSLMVAILAPSITTLMELDVNNPVVMDLNDEEESQEAKEFIGLAFLLNLKMDFYQVDKKSLAFSRTIGYHYSGDIEVSLPPPKL